MAESREELIRRGVLLLDRSRFEDAAPFFQQALASDPTDAWVLSQLAICQSHLKGRQWHALETINAALGFEPDNELHYGMKGMILCQLGQFEAALRTVGEGIAIRPDEPFLRAAEAQAYLGMKRWQGAERAARQALAIDPDHDLASHQLIQALYEQNQGEETPRTRARADRCESR